MAWSISASANTMFGLLPPSSSVTRFRLVLRGRLHDQVADFGRSGERDFIDIHVARDGRAGRRSVARQHVHHAVREAGFHDQFADAQRGQRRLLGGLHHHCVAGGQRRRQLPRLHQQREIPGNDLPHHAHRLVPRVAEIIAADREWSCPGPYPPSPRSSGSRRSVSGRSAAFATAYGLPLSSDSSRASSSACFSIRSASRFSSRPRSAADILRQGALLSKAARAALTARSTSAASASATSQMASPVAGLMVGKRFAGSAIDPLVVDEKFRRRHGDAFFSRGSGYSCHK